LDGSSSPAHVPLPFLPHTSSLWICLLPLVLPSHHTHTFTVGSFTHWVLSAHTHTHHTLWTYSPASTFHTLLPSGWYPQDLTPLHTFCFHTPLLLLPQPFTHTPHWTWTPLLTHLTQDIFHWPDSAHHLHTLPCTQPLGHHFILPSLTLPFLDQHLYLPCAFGSHCTAFSHIHTHATHLLFLPTHCTVPHLTLPSGPSSFMVGPLGGFFPGLQISVGWFYTLVLVHPSWTHNV